MTIVRKQPEINSKLLIPNTSIQVVRFQLRFHTVYGQELFISGNHPLLGSGNPDKAVAMQYDNDSFWSVEIDFSADKDLNEPIHYQYILRNANGVWNFESGDNKVLDPAFINSPNITTVDAWNYAGFYENAFYTEPFVQVLLKANHTAVEVSLPNKTTHFFKVKTPLLPKGQTVCLIGSCKTLSKWKTDSPVLMSRNEGDDYYAVPLDLSADLFPIAYKYGVYDTIQKTFVQFEQGNNRILYEPAQKLQQTILHDGFMVLPNLSWKGAGVAIPVFSLRSEQSFGVGEFNDLKLLVDWSKKVGLKLIQILPVNDTTATHTWTDSYPYAAISAFALHPMYLNLDLLVQMG